MKLSLIIPIYNERSTIDACLDNLDRLEGEVEVLFADGGSTDGTRERIGDRYPVLSCPKGRAAQMNAAARAAGGEVLWFAHCDCLLPPDGPAQIGRAVAGGVFQGGSLQGLPLVNEAYTSGGGCRRSWR